MNRKLPLLSNSTSKDKQIQREIQSLLKNNFSLGKKLQKKRDQLKAGGGGSQSREGGAAARSRILRNKRAPNSVSQRRPNKVPPMKNPEGRDSITSASINRKGDLIDAIVHPNHQGKRKIIRKRSNYNFDEVIKKIQKDPLKNFTNTKKMLKNGKKISNQTNMSNNNNPNNPLNKNDPNFKNFNSNSPANQSTLKLQEGSNTRNFKENMLENMMEKADFQLMVSNPNINSGSISNGSVVSQNSISDFVEYQSINQSRLDEQRDKNSNIQNILSQNYDGLLSKVNAGSMGTAGSYTRGQASFEEASRNNTQKPITIMVDFPKEGDDGLGWRTYKFDLKGKAQIVDIKILIERDFGYAVEDILLFHNLREIQSDLIPITEIIKDCMIFTFGFPTLIFIAKNKPKKNIQEFNRPKFGARDIDLELKVNGDIARTSEEFLESDVEKVLLLPPDRSWTKEYFAYKKKTVESEEMIRFYVKNLRGQTINLENLDQYLAKIKKYSSGMSKTLKEFNETAKVCVRLINRWKLEPQEIKYLYGLSGKKYVMGGLLIREVDSVVFGGRLYKKPEQISRFLEHKIQMMNYIRNNQETLVVPLMCVLEYYGICFLVYSISAINYDTLVYGSFTEGLLLENLIDENKGVLVQLGKQLNIAKHGVTERATGEEFEFLLTPGIQIHKVKVYQDSAKQEEIERLYLIDVDYLSPFSIEKVLGGDERSSSGDLQALSRERGSKTVLGTQQDTLTYDGGSKQDSQMGETVKQLNMSRYSASSAKLGSKMQGTDVNFSLPADTESLFFCPLKMVLESQEEYIDNVFKPVSSLSKLKCDQCNDYIPDQHYYQYEKAVLVNKKVQTNDEPFWTNKVVNSATCCLKCYREKALYHKLKYPVKHYKMKSFRSNTLGSYYIHSETGEFFESLPCKKIPLNPDCCVKELDDDPELTNLEVRDLTKIQQLIYEIQNSKVQDIVAEIESLEVEVIDGFELEKYLKLKGVPIRFLGHFLEYSKLGYLKELIAREMVAQAAAYLIKKNVQRLWDLEDGFGTQNLKTVLCFHFNNIFSGEFAEGSKGEWRTLLRLVDELFDVKISLSSKESMHIKGLLQRLLQLVDAKLLVEFDQIDLTDKKPFMTDFFEVQECVVVLEVEETEPFEFFENQGDYFQKIGRPSSWWLTSGEDNKISIFFRSQAYHFSRLVRALSFFPLIYPN